MAIFINIFGRILIRGGNMFEDSTVELKEKFPMTSNNKYNHDKMAKEFVVS